MEQVDIDRLSAARGETPCDHPRFEKERYLGAHTGEYVCAECGETFMKGERDEIVAKRETNKPK